MRAAVFRSGWAALAYLVLGALPAPAAPLPEVIQQIKPGIVAVGTYQETRRPPAQFRGTGFVVGNGQYVVTNAHVLPARLDEENREVLGIFSTQGEASRLVPAKLVAKDDVFDVAILQFTASALPALSLGDDSAVVEGTPIAFTGFPIGPVLGLYPVTHTGIVSALTPNATPVLDPSQLSPDMVQSLKRKELIFQLDATAYPGNSGSPVYDPGTGKVIAVLSSVYIHSTKENLLSEPSGISYAIPIRHVRDLLATLPQ
jgi:S1-C subfamily serine protease